MSSVRKYKNNPTYFLNTALQIFKSKTTRTAVVEGVCDKRFLSQWIDESKFRFDGCDGKKLVEEIYEKSKSKPYSDFDFLVFFADVDFDIITSKGLHSSPSFIYNAFCSKKSIAHFNDLESFLINTGALKKVLINLDIDASEVSSIRSKLETASRFIGSLRAADIIIKQSKGLSSSVLNGLKVEGFFNSKDILINERDLLDSLPAWSNYREYVDDLVEEATRLNKKLSAPWSLSRGHDLTEMLALHLVSRGCKGLNSEKLELMLRLACELSDFKDSPMGKQLLELDNVFPANG